MTIHALPSDDWLPEEPPDLFPSNRVMEEPPDWVMNTALPEEPPDLFPTRHDLLLSPLAQYAPLLPAASDFPVPDAIYAEPLLDMPPELPAQTGTYAATVDRHADWTLHQTGILIEPLPDDEKYAVGVMELRADPATGELAGSYLHLADAPHLERAEDMQRNIYRLADEAHVPDPAFGDFTHGLVQQRGDWQPLTAAQWALVAPEPAPDTPDMTDDATWAAQDRLLSQAFENVGGLQREAVDQPHEVQQVIQQMGMQVDDFDPYQHPPPLFDESTNTAYWIGIG